MFTHHGCVTWNQHYEIIPLTTGLALQSSPLVLQPNSTGHQLQFKEPTQEEQLKTGEGVGVRILRTVSNTCYISQVLTYLSLSSRRRSLHSQLVQSQC